jgi:hypothetical protein
VATAQKYAEQQSSAETDRPVFHAPVNLLTIRQHPPARIHIPRQNEHIPLSAHSQNRRDLSSLP